MLVWAFRYLMVVILLAGAFAALKMTPQSGAGDEARRHAALAPPAAAPPPGAPVALETVLEPDLRGHYWVRAVLNGEPVTFIVDTGASDVILAPADAARLGIRNDGLRFERRYGTANGVILGAPVAIRELRIGQQSVYDLEAVVVDAPLEVSLLGTDFLRRLDGYEVRDGRLVLRW